MRAAFTELAWHRFDIQAIVENGGLALILDADRSAGRFFLLLVVSPGSPLIGASLNERRVPAPIGHVQPLNSASPSVHLTG